MIPLRELSRRLTPAGAALVLLLGAYGGGALAPQPAHGQAPQVSDADIRHEVQQRLDRADFVEERDLVLRVEDGVVYVGGRVDEPYAKDELERLVRETPGVRDVVIDPLLVAPGPFD